MTSRFIACLLVVLATTQTNTVHGVGDGCILTPISSDHIKLVALYSREFQVSSKPVQGLHISLEGDKAVRVTWLNPVPFLGTPFYPQCVFGISPEVLNCTAKGTAYTYKGGNFNMALNTALLDLSELVNAYTAIYYKCGDKKFGWSDLQWFTLHQPNALKQLADVTKKPCPFYRMCFFASKAQTIAVIGDLGVDLGKYTIASLARQAQAGNIQLLIHAGDITYADHYGGKFRNNSYVWVDYMNKMEPITSRVPYMVAPGNHESEFKFAAYLNWLKMPYVQSHSKSPFWFSFDYMGIHFVSFSTEHDFMQNSTQFHWMESDLKAANQNRAAVPWIFVFGHRPLYCTSIICRERCEEEANVYRSYLEDLLYIQKVDVYMSGHNHQYERSFPVYKQKAVQRDYHNPKAPVYIVNGGAGNPYLNDPTFEPKVSWRGFDKPTFDTGYLLFQPTRTELRFQYIVSKTNQVVDRFTISRSP